VTNLWTDPEHALSYLDRADQMTWRVEGMRRLADHLPDHAGRILDLGTGDGRTLALARSVFPGSEGVAVDFSDTMLALARDRFDADPRVEVVAHDLDQPLPDLGPFDLVVSSFAIHHVDDVRKQALYREIYEVLVPGGVFLNLEHVASATPELHLAFLAAMDLGPADDDPSNKLALVETQLGWLHAIGFAQVDCHWKWREMALLGAQKPA
jgi:tRNA (cmo5U34)-methyltransferase